MKFCVVAPHQTYLAQAGVRIRYERVASRLHALGHSLDICVVDEMQAGSEVHDAYLFSKVYDARSYIIAHRLSRNGRLIGVDLFDDYFSQRHDSRLTAQRRWLSTMAKWCGYVLCSTPRMKVVARRYMPDIPVHIVNDPYKRLELQALGNAVQEKVERALRTGQVDIAWFGNGDNPIFAVGLSDVHGFGSLLQQFGRLGFEPRLQLLTNQRALSTRSLEALNRIGLPWTLDEWTLQREGELLDRSLVAFIPVNAQAFSMAKSLNRAVSALSSATQVLSAGYPLYSPLAEFVYRDVDTLVHDLRNGAPRLRRETLPRLTACLAEWADPDREAGRLVEFLQHELRRSAKTRGQVPRPTLELGIVHGLRSSSDVHRVAQHHQVLSIGSPFSNPALDYDLGIVRHADATVSLEIDVNSLPRLHPDLLGVLSNERSRNGRSWRALALDQLFPQEARLLARAVAGKDSRLASFAIYRAAMDALFKVLHAALPGMELQLSEMEAPHDASDGPSVAPITQTVSLASA